MICSAVRATFSDYLDGAVSGVTMHAIAAHLEGCTECTKEFAAWRGMQQALAVAGKLKVPADLGLKLRLAISHESARRQGHWYDSLLVRWDNLLRPALVQVSAGFAGAIVLLGTIVMLVGVVATPQAVLANDEPLGALTPPHYLYSSARSQPVVTSEDTVIVIQADVNAAGRIYDYHLISGPVDEATEAQVRNQLMLQVYAPARVFDQPVRGHVLLTFAGVSVHS